ncbi:MAG: tetratricopeptide repeat protein [bacterium]|nr:tetratricopeptide repeat protein [bacterium]MDO8496372.1 tetratricopeptide repeat protein [bacterium]
MLNNNLNDFVARMRKFWSKMDLSFWKKDSAEIDSSNIEDTRSEIRNDVSRSFESVISPESESGTQGEPYHPEPADPEKSKFYNNISRWVLYVGAVLLPLFFLPFTPDVLNSNKQLLLVAVASVSLISWLLGVVSSGYLTWRNNPVDRGLLALLGAFVLASIFSVNSFKSIFGSGGGLSNSLVSIIALTIIYFLLVNISDDKGRFFRSLIGGSMIIALIYGLIQIFGLHIFRFSFAMSKSFNTVGSVNTLGLLAAIGLPFFSKNKLDLGFKITEKFPIEKMATVLSLVILVILNWWVLWVVAMAGMVSMIVFENLGRGRFKLRRILLPMMVIVLGVFMMIIKFDFALLKRDLPTEVAPSFKLSGDVLAAVLKEKLVFGYGLENFSVAFDKYGASSINNTSFSDARFFDATSEILTLLIEGGLIVGAAIAFLIISIGLLLWRFKKSILMGQDMESLRGDIGVLASFIALIAALFLYPLNLTMTLLLYLFMALSVLVVFGDERKEFNIEEKASLSLGSSLGFIGGLVLVLVGLYFSTTIYISKVTYAQAITNSDNQRAASLLVDSINWNSRDDAYYRTASRTALQLLAKELNAPANNERNARVQNYVSSAVSLAKQATDVNPSESLNWDNLGFVYQNLLAIVDGVDKLAEDAYLTGSKLRPGDPAFTYKIGMLYLSKFDRYGQLNANLRASVAKDAQASLVKAAEYLKKSTDLSSNFGLAIYNLGVVYERQGELTEAIQQLEKVAPANSNQPGLAFELGLLYYRAGRKDDAFNALQRAVVLAPDYSNARWYLALILEERKDLDGAIQQLQRILDVDVNKDNPEVMQKLDELRTGTNKTPPDKVLDQQPLR